MAGFRLRIAVDCQTGRERAFRRFSEFRQEELKKTQESAGCGRTGELMPD